MLPQFTVTDDTTNKDLKPGETLQQAHERYAHEIWNGFEGRMPEPTVHEHEFHTGDKGYILRADLAPAGLKSFAAEQLVATAVQNRLVYVAPRVGHAPDAIATLAKMHDKEVTFFCPAARKPSRHQAALLAHDHVELRFVRIAAMPVLNKIAREWSGDRQALYMPFGLTNTPSVTAGIVNLCRKITDQLGENPTASVCAVSTGTMIRGLEIGWPEADHYGVAVARNMHSGEIGCSTVIAHHMRFLQDEHKSKRPPFPSTANYDAKAWETFEGMAIPGSIFINVGSDDVIERNLALVDVDDIDSYREWGDMMDLEI